MRREVAGAAEGRVEAADAERRRCLPHQGVVIDHRVVAGRDLGARVAQIRRLAVAGVTFDHPHLAVGAGHHEHPGLAQNRLSAAPRDEEQLDRPLPHDP